MKKYPVTYKGKAYEVRWNNNLLDSIGIYEVSFLNLKIYKYGCYTYYLDEYLPKGITENHPDYYIEQVKTLFYLWERSCKEKETAKLIEKDKQMNLEEWDGVVK